MEIQNGKLTFESNGIKIGKGIKHINVKGIATIVHHESDGRTCFLYIRKNGNIITTNKFRMQEAEQPYTLQVNAEYMEVKENDLIQLYVAMDNSNFRTESDSTNQLSVQVVD